MSMSTYIIGFRPPDELWQKMKAIYDACEAGGIGIPDEVSEFFNDEPPDEKGIEVDLDDILEEWSNHSSEGYQLELSKLPKDITILRFCNSW